MKEENPILDDINYPEDFKKIHHRAIKDFFPEHAGRDELIASNKLDSESIVSFVTEIAGYYN